MTTDHALATDSADLAAPLSLSGADLRPLPAGVWQGFRCQRCPRLRRLAGSPAFINSVLRQWWSCSVHDHTSSVAAQKREDLCVIASHDRNFVVYCHAHGQNSSRLRVYQLVYCLQHSAFVRCCRCRALPPLFWVNAFLCVRFGFVAFVFTHADGSRAWV